MSPGRHLLLYDRDCGFCRWSVAWVLRWDRSRALEPLALQEPRATRLTPDLDAEQRMRSTHLISPTGERFSGGEAAAPILRLLPGGAPLAALARRVPGLADRAYGWVAGNRDRLGRLIGSSARRRADTLIASRDRETRVAS